MDARFRRKFPKPEQSGLNRIDAIETVRGKPIQDYDQGPGRQLKPAKTDSGDPFVNLLGKIIKKKKQLP